MIDTHTHLYLQQFDGDRDEIMQRAKDAGVAKFLLPAIDQSTTSAMLNIEAKYPQAHAMMGLHPCSVNADWQEELNHVEEMLAKRPFIAVGEIGLDLYWDKTFEREQYEVFNVQMELALKYNLPIAIHTRSAMQQTIDSVKPFALRGLTGVFHCFGDSFEMARQILDFGFYLGIGGVVTYKNSGLSETLRQVPLNRILLETDSPYLTPVPFRGKRNESSYLHYIAEKLKEIYNTTLAEIDETTTQNAVDLFGIPGWAKA